MIEGSTLNGQTQVHQTQHRKIWKSKETKVVSTGKESSSYSFSKVCNLQKMLLFIFIHSLFSSKIQWSLINKNEFLGNNSLRFEVKRILIYLRTL